MANIKIITGGEKTRIEAVYERYDGYCIDTVWTPKSMLNWEIKKEEYYGQRIISKEKKSVIFWSVPSEIKETYKNQRKTEFKSERIT